MPTSRRSFVQAAGAALLGLAGAPAVHAAPRRQRPDVVIRGGTVFDGTGAPGVEADVAIAGGRVTRVARAASPARARWRSTRAGRRSRRGSSTSTRTPTARCSPTRSPSRCCGRA